MRILVTTILAATLLITTARADTQLLETVTPGYWPYQTMDYLQRQGFLDDYPAGYFTGDRVLARFEFGVYTYLLLDDERLAYSPEPIRLLIDILYSEFFDIVLRLRRNEVQGYRELHNGPWPPELNDLFPAEGDFAERIRSTQYWWGPDLAKRIILDHFTNNPPHPFVAETDDSGYGEKPREDGLVIVYNGQFQIVTVINVVVPGDPIEVPLPVSWDLPINPAVLDSWVQ